ncbi:MAG: FG-GAP-like repeat-containing protein [Cytophagaceae bacterium]|jgi:hypothetical protein|nr:FG-GAP-like repeat-containing protein [Cytophagaceae bacterium]
MNSLYLSGTARAVHQFKRYVRKYNRLLEKGNASNHKLKFLQKRIEKLRTFLKGILTNLKLSGALASLAVLLNSTNVHAQVFGPVSTNPFNLTDVPNVNFINAFAQGDLDNDGDEDILTSAYRSSNDGAFYYYENTGSIGAPSFGTPISSPFSLPTKASDVYIPTLVDLDNDGDLDIMAGNYSYTNSSLYYFRNTGTPTAPSFAAPVADPFGINTSSLDYYSLYNSDFADLDNDGDLDMLVGDYGANLYYFQNTGTASSPSFASPVMNAFGLSAGFRWAAPEFTDYDGDGDLDVLSGDRNDGFNYYENTGTVTSPSFATKVNNPDQLGFLGSIGAFPELYDYDNDGDDDLLISSATNKFYYHERCTLPVAPTNSTPSVDLNICAGSNTTLSVSGSGTFKWYNATTNGTLLFTGASYVTGNFSEDTAIYVRASDGCGNGPFTTIAINVAQPNIATTTTDPTISAVSSGATYTWIDCNNSNQVIGGQTSQSFTAVANGNYAVIVTEGACSDTSACVSITSIVSSLTEALDVNNIQVMPNPNNGEFVINLPVGSSLSISNSLGEIVYTSDNSKNLTSINMNNVASGVYTLKVTNNGKTDFVKFVKE